MIIQEIKSKKEWQTFVALHAPRSGAFLHAWEYGEMGAVRLGVYEGGVLVAVAMVTEMSLPFGLSYTLVQKGPIVKEGANLKAIVESIGRFFPRAVFVRFEPQNNHHPFIPSLREPEGSSEPRTALKRRGKAWAKKTVHVSPEETLLLDLSKSQEELLSTMHQKTRYNIRLAEKKGVEVRELERAEWALAWKVFDETARRDGFRLHAKERYVAWLEMFPTARLVGAFFEGDLLAVNLMVDAFGTRTYLHGASSSTHREVMAPYALHWQEIVQAKEAGLLTYDFWGISDTNPAWKGITRFKLGFGGERVTSPGTFDFVITPWKYQLYRALRFLRRRGN